MRLIKRGGRLVALGAVANDPRRWHVIAGGVSAPVLGPATGGDGLRIGRALCGREVMTNGYPADFRPPESQLCSACSERI